MVRPLSVYVHDTQEMKADDRNGEKLLLVSHPKLDMDTILAFTSLWWFTDTYPSSIYPYRQVSPSLCLVLSFPLSLFPAFPRSPHLSLSASCSIRGSVRLTNSSWALKWVNQTQNRLNHSDILISPMISDQPQSNGSRRM